MCKKWDSCYNNIILLLFKNDLKCNKKNPTFYFLLLQLIWHGSWTRYHCIIWHWITMTKHFWELDRPFYQCLYKQPQAENKLRPILAHSICSRLNNIETWIKALRNATFKIYPLHKLAKFMDKYNPASTFSSALK